jgi:PhnB protein
MHVQVYLGFNGRCEEAIRFYQSAVGAEVQLLMRHKDSPQPAPPGVLPDGSGDKIMHVSLRIGDTIVMASDAHCTGQTVFEGFSLSLGVATADEADRAFARLAEGGRVTMPLAKTFWSPHFGMLVDRFGVSWMVTVTA